MNQRHVLTIQLDRNLRNAFEVFCDSSKARLGRELTEAEAARFLLRKALDAKVSMTDAGYVEGFRRGMAEAKEAFARGMAQARKRELEIATTASG